MYVLLCPLSHLHSLFNKPPWTSLPMTEPHAPTEHRENKCPRNPSPTPESDVDRQRRQTNLPITTPAPNPPAATPPNAAATQLPAPPAAQPAGTGSPASGTPSPWNDGKHTIRYYLAPQPKPAQASLQLTARPPDGFCIPQLGEAITRNLDQR